MFQKNAGQGRPIYLAGNRRVSKYFNCILYILICSYHHVWFDCLFEGIKEWAAMGCVPEGILSAKKNCCRMENEKQQYCKWSQRLRRSERTSKCREWGSLLWHDVEFGLENFANVKTIVALKNEMKLNESKVYIEAMNDLPTEYISMALSIVQS